MESKDDPIISVVVPIYKCEGCLDELCRQIVENLFTLTNHFEIILVDDRSPDNSWNRIQSLQKRFSSIKGIRLSRNFGQHIAITAGLSEARGNFAVVMDCDLQDPPSLIPHLYNKIHEGYDFVIGKRIDRTHSIFRRVAAKIYFKLLSRLTEEPFDGSYGSFSILSRKVIDAFLLFGERERHYLFILRWLGFNIGFVDYFHQNRYSGHSSYSFGRLIKHALSGIMFQSTVILRWIINMGFMFAAGGSVFALYLIFMHIYKSSLPGWTSLIVMILVCTGVILMTQGIIGLYIGRIFDQTKQRPLYVVDVISERIP